jgi:ribosome-binding protein aMBF1 (putative translation factor)
MVICDLCGQPKNCIQVEIAAKEHDVCRDCWDPIAEKLAGKGRPVRRREPVFLPPLTTKPSPEPETPRPNPGEPPKIWGGADPPH